MLLRTRFFSKPLLILLIQATTVPVFAYKTEGRPGSDNIEDRRPGAQEMVLFQSLFSTIFGVGERSEAVQHRQQENKSSYTSAFVSYYTKKIADYFYINCVRANRKLLGDEKNTMAVIDDLGKILSLSAQFNSQPSRLPEKTDSSSLYRNKVLSRKMFFCMEKTINETFSSPDDRKTIKKSIYFMMTLEMNKDDVRTLKSPHLFVVTVPGKKPQQKIPSKSNTQVNQ